MHDALSETKAINPCFCPSTGVTDGCRHILPMGRHHSLVFFEAILPGRLNRHNVTNRYGSQLLDNSRFMSETVLFFGQ
jgi:hypothetical protein